MTDETGKIKVAEFWNRESVRWGKKYEVKSSYYYRSRTFLAFFEELGLKGAKILDFGCGSGDITLPMVRQGHSVVGVDIANDMIEAARRKAKESGASERASYYYLDDGVYARIGALKFDVVICSSVLEYVDDDLALLELFKSVLGTNGVLILSIPDEKSLFCKLDRYVYRNKVLFGKILPVDKLNYLDIQKRQYDINDFVSKMKSIGFNILKSRYNTIAKQKGPFMEKLSNIPGVGMLCIAKFRKE